MGILDRTPPPPTIRIPYGDGEFHFGDLRLPEGNGPFPMVMNIHGGFWRAQYDLTHAGHLCAALSRKGIATWNIEYRRLGHRGGGWTGTFEDVGRAADSLRTLAEQYPLDLSHVVVMGHSAGGHLALWVGARPAFKRTHSLYVPEPFAFKGVVALAPVADLKMGWQMGLSNGVVETLMGGSPTRYPDRYAQASPIALLPLGIPQIVVHGARDEIVPLQIGAAYVQQAQTQGDTCRLERVPAAGHFELIDPQTPEWRVVEAAVLSLLEG